MPKLMGMRFRRFSNSDLPPYLGGRPAGKSDEPQRKRINLRLSM
ncbi:hypothetical protein GGD46_004112 [Rhizobium lusitanum]|uniref:Uncharacterized protein n=1 Tax=Rhizobium lusitanum TaxID=293958 RepID=A0A7X0ITC4_9HYPH|nr:hypothetical protein [Rhizobium lusitanum]